MNRKEIIRMGLVASIAIALLPGARAADGPPQVNAVASATVVDSTGKPVGNVIGLPPGFTGAGPVTVMVEIAGNFFSLNIAKLDLVATSVNGGPMFTTSDCSGTPYVPPPDPFFMVQPSVIGLPGRTLYVFEPGALPQIVNIGSYFGVNVFGAAPFCVQFVAQNVFAAPAVPLVDLSTVFKPPFSLRIKNVSSGD